MIAAALLGCPIAEERRLDIAAVLPVLDPRAATELVLPLVAPDTGALATGWSIPRDPVEDATRYRAVSSPAEVGFWWAAEADAVMVAELRPAGDLPASAVSVTVNGETVATEPLAQRWQRLRVRIPRSAIRVGYNRLALEFAPAGTTAPLARFRHLALHSGVGRPPWPDRRAVISVAGTPGVSGAPDPAVEGAFAMTTDALLDVAIRAPAGARLVGDVVVVGRGPAAADAPAAMESEPREPAAGGLIHVRVEQVLSDRSVVSLLEHSAPIAAADATTNATTEATVGSGPPSVPFDVGLSVRPDGLARVRLRVWGEVNGLAVWRSLSVVGRGPVEVAGTSAEALPAATSGGAGRPDVVVVLLDAARADAVSAYGGTYPTPTLDAIARDGTRFDRAYSPSSWTGPAVASSLTGHYAEAHGSDAWNRHLSKLVPAVAQILADTGYRTVLWSQHLAYTGNPTLRRGFEEIVASPYRERQLLPDAGILFDDERPTFAWVHLLLPHAPYEPPAPHRGAYTDAAPGDGGGVLDVSPQALSALQGTNVDPQIIAYVRARYDETMRWADAQVGRIVEAIEARGRRDQTLLVVTSDHGEAFHEHGRFLHTRDLYQEVLHIPWLIRWPASMVGPRAVVDAPVSLVDLAPTIVDALGVEDPRAVFQGTSLVPAVFGSGLPPRAVHAATRMHERVEHRPSPLAAVVHFPLKAVFHEPTGRLAVYDLAADPGERTDLSGSDPVRDQLLLQSILMLRARSAALRGDRADEVLDPELEEALRALGYIG